MTLSPLALVALFVASAVIGYLLIRNVPSLLHTPLMSGMNALSGVAVVGALGAAVFLGGRLLAGIAIVLATVNVVSGFRVTGRMLAMFKKGERGDE